MKKINILGSIVIIFLIAILFIFSLKNSKVNDLTSSNTTVGNITNTNNRPDTTTSLGLYIFEISCILDTQKECIFSSCENNCPNDIRFKGWTPTKEKLSSTKSLYNRGVIKNIDTSMLSVDGDLIFDLVNPDNVISQVRVPSDIGHLCLANLNLNELISLQDGDKVEVLGAFMDGALYPCGSVEHYINRVNY